MHTEKNTTKKLTHHEIVAIEERDWADRKAKYEVAIQKKQKMRAAAISKMRNATPADYRRFLKLRTKDCTHFYGYDMPSDDFYVAYKDIDLPPLCGSQAIHVIAMPGVRVRHDGTDTTHCEIFSFDDPDKGRWVPSYNNAHM